MLWLIDQDVGIGVGVGIAVERITHTRPAADTGNRSLTLLQGRKAAAPLPEVLVLQYSPARAAGAAIVTMASVVSAAADAAIIFAIVFIFPLHINRRRFGVPTAPDFLYGHVTCIELRRLTG
jgi:hypothetical protein